MAPNIDTSCTDRTANKTQLNVTRVCVFMFVSSPPPARCVPYVPGVKHERFKQALRWRYPTPGCAPVGGCTQVECSWPMER
jgi:hypothetical protein